MGKLIMIYHSQSIKQSDLTKRVYNLYIYMEDSELRCISDWIQLGKYNKAYNMIKEVELRANIVN